jgi:transcriptional regulator with XRE-family HTH domain
MAGEEAETLPRVGARLRALRTRNGISLREMARKVGCSEGHLSKIENDKTGPSLAVLHRLASALDVNLAVLFQDDAQDEPRIVSRAGERPIIQLDPLRRGMGLTLERVIPYDDHVRLQCNIHVMEPGGSSDGCIQHEGEEMGYVLAGQVELTVGGKTYRLEKGDSFHFASTLPHGYRNPGTATARILWVNTPPTF